MSDDEYIPLIDRVRESKSRVHEELTQPARERLAAVTDDWGRSYLKSQNDHKRHKSEAFRDLMKSVGKTPVSKAVTKSSENGDSIVSSHNSFINNGKTEHILTYIEILSIKWGSYDKRRASKVELLNKWGELQNNSKYSDLYNVIVTEGLLWKLEWAGEGGIIEFRPLESEAMAEIDTKVQALAEEEPWEDALEGYNAAFERYLDGDFDDVLVKKLYNSIEEVLQTICVDLGQWTDDRNKSHKYYLDLLRENKVYNANGITTPELNQLLDSLEKLVNKVGNDRKQRHAYHDRAYCTLLIHQVGAYLYFLISRYDDYAIGVN